MAGKVAKVFQSNLFAGIADRQKKIALEIYAGLTERTPRDTGRATASWRMAKGSPDSSVEPEGQGSYTVTQYDLNVQIGEVIYISNNLPYIKPLNEGHSEQAGNFFIEREVAAATKRALGR